ncbi:MAG TPA: hypothetical protein VM452_00250 [Caulifigura sp.]|nr:hypothetical protein [Caulifigura sp.]
MIRKTLALLVRALRVDARNLRPHLIRFGLLATILWLLFLAQEMSQSSGAPGLRLFESLTYVNIWFITFVGVTYFASAITEEKEERTLGLLRMADIGALSILLGKWVPRMVGLLALIAVQFPFTLLAITLGGVTLLQVTAVYVALLLHLLCVGTYSLLASVYCRSTGKAVQVAFIALLLRWLVPLFAGMLSALSNVRSGPLDAIAAARQAFVFHLTDRALSPTFVDTPFPPAAAWWLAESGLLFLISWLIFEPCTRGDLVEVQPSLWTRLMTKKKRSNHRRAWTAAIAGKDYMLLSGGVRGTTLRFTIYFGILAAFLAVVNINGGSIGLEEVGGAMFGFGIAFLALDILQSAAKVFRIELQEQTWSALMMLPRSLNGVAWSKIGGCAVGWWPSLLMICLGGLFVPRFVATMLEIIFSPDGFFPVAYSVLQVFLFVELTILISISLTWAAWPLAAPLSFFIIGLCNALIMTCLAMAGLGNSLQVLFFLLAGVSGVVAAVLYQRIGARLLDKASDGA